MNKINKNKTSFWLFNHCLLACEPSHTELNPDGFSFDSNIFVLLYFIILMVKHFIVSQENIRPKPNHHTYLCVCVFQSTVKSRYPAA